jgi:RNA polymerase sigma factor (sigma-70 family)
VSPEEEQALVFAAQAGAPAARAELIETFTPAIARGARHYPGVALEELVQEGAVGLLRAASRYDPRMGTPFWAYAAWWVRQAMKQLLSETTRPVALPDRAKRRLARLREARRRHLVAEGVEPSPDELAAATGLDRYQVEDLLAVELVTEPAAEAELGSGDRRELVALRDLTGELDERERETVLAHYGIGRPPETLSELAARLDLSVERVRQIEAEAMSKVRDAAMQPALRT